MAALPEPVAAAPAPIPLFDHGAAAHGNQMSAQNHFKLLCDEASNTWYVEDEHSDEIAILPQPTKGETWELSFDEER